MYGTQAGFMDMTHMVLFENDVKMYGTQALNAILKLIVPFENDVKMYGTQAHAPGCR